MKFCRECGTSLHSDATFCQECGEKVVQPQNNDINEVPESHHESSSNKPFNPVNKDPKKPPIQWTKKNKVIASIVGACVVLLFIVFQIGSTLTDKDRLISNLSEAILDKDSETIMGMLSSDDPRLEITEAGVASILEFLAANPSYYSSLMESLNYQSRQLDLIGNKTEDDTYDFYDYSQSIFYLKKEGKTALFFDKYTIEVVPFYIRIETNHPDAIVTLNGEEIAISNSYDFSIEYGPLMPGVYELKSQYAGEYTILETSEIVSLLNPYDHYSYADLSLYGDYISIYSDYQDMAVESKVFINGNETGLSLHEAQEIGPITTDGEMKVHAEMTFPWGSAKTDESVIDGRSIRLTISNPLNEKEKDTIMDTIHSFAHEWAEAYESLDETKFSTVTSNYLNYVKNDFSSMKDYDRRWKGEYLKGIFDLNSFNVYKVDNKYYTEVRTTLYYDSVSYRVDDEDLTTEESENNWVYKLVYDEEKQKWMLDDYNSMYSIDHSNSKELVASGN
ncbi:zinc ribbon domain-containing protein [Alkalihalobacterium sp. APHAB7]|uniref:zinc ribbon domain-containing protein n=1 Tax=Alkalihalobacterium sp. APHAB7 TaxID=3402081 RepID=UPI003AAECD35